MGSVFQLRDFWWQSFPGEEFSPTAVAVGDLDNLDTIDKVAVGSFQGFLRILLPGTTRGDAQPADTLYEQKFDEPILQLACGRFQPVGSENSRNLLAVLFPRRLALLSLERLGSRRGRAAAQKDGDSGGESDGGRGMDDVHYKCELHFQTHFDHTVYNMTSGPFGRATHDLICVQSMDGQLTIVDHNKVICQRFFPSNQFLVPGSLTYCPQRDTFLTNNSSMFLMCYEFSNIANSVGSERKGGGDEETDDRKAISASGGGSGVKIAPAWAFNIGDDAVDIRVCRLARGLAAEDGNVVVLCPYSLIVLSLDGECMFTKRLDVETCCLSVFPLPQSNADNLLVGALNGSVYVYSDAALEWSAVMQVGCPLHLSVATLCGTQGMVLALSSEAALSVNYLGTDPADAPLQPLESKTATYTDMNRELRAVQQTIRRLLEEGEEDAAGGGGGGGAGLARSGSNSPTAAPAAIADRTAASVAERATPALAGGDASREDAGPAPARGASDAAATGTLSSDTAAAATSDFALSLSFGEVEVGDRGERVLPLHVRFTKPFQHLQTLQDVVVQIDTVDPVSVFPRHKVLSRISVGESLTVPLQLSAAPDKDEIVPSSIELDAVAVFTGKRYDTWATRRKTHVPFSLVARPVPPVKNTAFSLQLNTNKSPPPSLLDLFEDLAACGNVAANVLSIHYLNGADATILVSKNAARFKLQGSTMEGLWLLTSELVRRLRAHYESEGDLVFSIPDEVPLADFTAIVDTHAAIRMELVDAVANLDRAAQFLRSVEKRLLARFRDRSPSNSDTMTLLFEESYALLQKATDDVVVAKSRQRQACAMLNCCARLVFFWMRVKYPESFHKMAELKKKEARAVTSTKSTGTTVAGGQSRAAATTEDVLRELFTCDITADDGVGWEEVTEAALAQLLDVKARKVGGKNLEVSLNTANVKKYFTQLVDHIKAGGGF